MPRQKKQITIYKEAIDNLSYRDRLKEYLRLFFADNESSTEEKTKLILKSFSNEEKKLFNNYYQPLFEIIIKEKNRIKTISISVEYYALYVNDILKDIESNTQNILFINSVLSEVKKISKTESTDLEDIHYSIKRIENLLRTYRSISGGVVIDNTKYYLNVNYEPYLVVLNDGISKLTRTLRTAKGFYVAFDEYIRIYDIYDIIPKEVYDLGSNVKKDLSFAWWNSSRVYKQYSSKENRTEEENKIIDTIHKSILFPNLFPDYEFVEPSTNLIGEKNIFIEQCAVKQKI